MTCEACHVPNSICMGVYEEEDMIGLCRPCHAYVHDLTYREEFAEIYQSFGRFFVTSSIIEPCSYCFSTEYGVMQDNFDSGRYVCRECHKTTRAFTEHCSLSMYPMAVAQAGLSTNCGRFRDLMQARLRNDPYVESLVADCDSCDVLSIPCMAVGNFLKICKQCYMNVFMSEIEENPWHRFPAKFKADRPRGKCSFRFGGNCHLFPIELTPLVPVMGSFDLIDRDWICEDCFYVPHAQMFSMPKVSFSDDTLDSVDKFSDSITTFGTVLDGVKASFSEGISDIRSAMQMAVHSADSLQESVTTAMKSVKDLIRAGDLPLHVLNIAEKIFSLYGFITLYPDIPEELRSKFTLVWLTSLGVASKVATLMYDGLVLAYSCLAQGPVPISENLVQAIYHIVVNAFSGKTTMVDEVRARLVSSHIRFLEDINKLPSLVIKIIETIRTLFYDPDAAQIAKISKSMQEWIHKTVELVPTDFVQDMFQDVALAGEVLDLYTTGMSFKEDCARLPLDPKLVSSYQSVISMLSHFRDQMMAHGRMNTQRSPPVCVNFFGPAGIGKSFLLDHIMVELSKRTGVLTKDNIDKLKKGGLCFSKNFTDKFFDGYKHQPFVILDDPFYVQTEEVAVAVADFLNGAVNTAPYQLNMANLDGKSGVFFDSPWILCSNNVSMHGMHRGYNLPLANFDAFRRRVHLDIKVDVKPQFLDKAGYIKKDLTPEEQRTVYSFIVCEMQRKTASYDDENFKSVVIMETDNFDKIVELLMSRRANKEDSFKSALLASFAQTGWDEMIGNLEFDYSQPDITFKSLGKTCATCVKSMDCECDVQGIGLFEVSETVQGLPVTELDDGRKIVHVNLIGTASDARQYGNITMPKSVAKKCGPSYLRKVIDNRIPICQSAVSSIKAAKLRVSEFMESNATIIKSLGIVAAVVGLAYAASRFFLRGGEYLAEGPYAGTSNAKHKPMSKLKPLRVSKLASAQASTIHSAAHDFVSGKFPHHNIFNIMFGNLSKDSHVSDFVQMTMLTPQLGVSVFHYLSHVPKDCDTLILQGEFNVHRVPLADLKMVNFEDRDIVFVYFPTPLQRVKNISDKLIETIPTGRFDAFQVRRSNDAIFACIGGVTIKSAMYVDANYGDLYNLANSFAFAGPSKGGMCGSPYVRSDGRDNRFLFGIHVAGHANLAECYGTWLTKEMLDKVMSEIFGATAQAGFMVDNLPSNSEFVENVPPSQQKIMMLDSEIVASPAQGLYQEPVTRPAILRRFRNAKTHEKIDPLVTGLQKLSKDTTFQFPEVAKKFLPHVIDSVSKRLFKMEYPIRTLTLDEAINGLTDGQHLGPLMMSTAPGIDPSLPNGSGGKYHLFVCRNCGAKAKCPCKDIHAYKGYDPTPELREAVESILNDLRDGKDPQVYGQCCMKDERRPIDKVEKGKVRIFIALPTAWLLVRRMLFGTFLENLMRNPIGVSALGINPLGYQWTQLLEYLEGASNDMAHDDDFSDFDASIPKEVHEAAIEIDRRLLMLTGVPQELVQMAINCHNVTYFKLILQVLDVRFKVKNGFNPSGDFFTTYHNIKCNAILHCLAWLMASHFRGDTKTAEDYFEEFRVTFFGDDSFEAFCQKVNGWYTLNLKMQMMLQLGMKLTHGSKQAVDFDYRPIRECNFLKRTFRSSDGVVYAPLEINVIKEIPNWVRKNLRPDEAAIQNILSALREAFLHGEDTFAETHNIAASWIFQNGGDLTLLPSYDKLYREYHEVGFNDFLRIAQAKRSKRKVRRISDLQPFGSGETKVYDIRHVRADTYLSVESFLGIFVPRAQSSAEEMSMHEAKSSEQENLERMEEVDLISVNEFIRPAQLSIKSQIYEDQHIRELVSRSFILPRISWATTTTKHTLLGVYSMASLTSIPIVSEILSRFHMYRFDIEYTIIVNAPKTMAGLLLITQLPYLVTGTYSQLVNAAPVILNVQTHNQVRIVVPYNLVRDYLVTTPSGVGRIGLIPITNLLEASGEARTVPILVTARIINIDVVLPKAQSGSIAEENNEVVKEGIISKPLSKLSQLLEHISVIPFYGTELRLASELIGALSKTARYFGMTKTTNVVAPSITTMVSTSNMAHGRGIDSGSKLGLDPSGGVIRDFKEFGTSIDYDLLDNYKLIPWWWGDFTYNSATANGARVGVIPIIANGLTNGTAPRQFMATAIDLFTYWRGGVKFNLQFNTTIFNTSQVVLMHFPPGATIPVSLDLVELGNVPHMFVDVIGYTDVCITIPFLFRTAYARIGDLLGNLVVYAINPPQALTSAGNTSVEVDLFVSFAEDACFYRPRNLAVAEAGSLDCYDMRGKFRKPFPSLTGHMDMWVRPLDTQNERVVRFTELLSRFTYFTSVTSDNVLTVLGIYDSNTVFSNILRLFYLSRGSFRFKFIPRSSTVQRLDVGNWNTTDSIVVQPSDLSGVNIELRSPKIANEVTVPMYISQNNYWNHAVAGDDMDTQGIFWRIQDEATEADPIDVYIAIGDDFSLGYPFPYSFPTFV